MRRKFCNWDDKSRKFAELAAKEEHWEGFISLLDDFSLKSEASFNDGILDDGVRFIFPDEISKLMSTVTTDRLGKSKVSQRPARHVLADCNKEELEKICGYLRGRISASDNERIIQILDFANILQSSETDSNCKEATSTEGLAVEEIPSTSRSFSRHTKVTSPEEDSNEALPLLACRFVNFDSLES